MAHKHDDAVGIHLMLGTSMEQLIVQLMPVLENARHDPFIADVLIVPDAAHARIVAHHIAPSLGAGTAGDGIAAGISFLTLSQLLSLMAEKVCTVPLAEMPWRSDRLAWTVMEVIDANADATWAAPLLATYPLPGDDPARQGRRVARATQLAKLFTRYLHERPALLEEWASGKKVPDEVTDLAWQPPLWRAIIAAMGVDPIDYHRQLVAAVAAGPVPGLPSVISCVCPPRLGVTESELISAVAQHHRLCVGLVDLAARGVPTELMEVLGAESDRTISSWQAIADSSQTLPPQPSWNPTVVEHVCHGPDRQVEVLRDALLHEFATDPTLEPRDVIIHCPDVPTFAPHLAALFRSGDEDHPNPAAQLRLRISDSTVVEMNPVMATLDGLLALGLGRATRSHLVELVGDPRVARRFGLGDDDIIRLTTLIDRAHIAWGISAEHRKLFGLKAVGQGTWQAGVDRLLAGASLSNDIFAPLGTALAEDDVSSKDFPLIGRLTELVYRVRVLADQIHEARSVQSWCAIARQTLDDFIDVAPTESWQIHHAYGVLADLSESVQQSPLIGIGDFRVLLSRRSRTTASRSAVGTGALLVCADSSLLHAPRRLTVLLGHDDICYPRRSLSSGDDMLRRLPAPDYDRDVAAESRLALALAATTCDRLLVIHQGFDPTTNKTVPCAGPLEDLLHAIPPQKRSTFINTLQPFSPRNFDAVALPRSFDARAAAGAVRLAQQPTATLPKLLNPEEIPARDPKALWTINDLSKMLKNPCGEFLQERAGLRFYSREEASDDLPIELNALEKWAIGNRIHTALQHGYTLDDAGQAEILSGALPPGTLGEVALDDGKQKAHTAQVAARPWLSIAPQDHAINIDLDTTTIRGIVRTHDDTVLTVVTGNISGKHLLDAWLHVLCLHASVPGQWVARVVSPRTSITLGAGVDHTYAQLYLSRVIMFAEAGRRQPLPWSPRLAPVLAGRFDRRYSPADPQFWEHDELSKPELWEREPAELRAFYNSTRELFIPDVTDEFRGTGQRTLAAALLADVWRPLAQSMEEHS